MKHNIEVRVLLEVESGNMDSAEQAAAAAVENALKLVELNGFNYFERLAESVHVTDVEVLT